MQAMRKLVRVYLMLLFLVGFLGCGNSQYASISQAIQQGCNVVTVGVDNGQVPNGGSLITCVQGDTTTSSLIINGTTFAPIQFCPGSTTYPSQFNEVGFCINGSLYAVYSANDGFLTVIPDGVYSSDGINSSCTFTVTGCSVSN